MADGHAMDAPAVRTDAPSSGGPGGRPRRVPRTLVVALVVVLLAGLAGWALGGFDERRDYASAQPGEEIDAGNLVFVLDDATAQQDSTGTWTLILHGTVSNPHDESLAPVQGGAGNLAVVPARGQQSAVLSSVELGGTWRRTVVPPGGTPVELAAGFTLPARTRFADTVVAGVFPFEYTDNSVLGVSGGQKTWNPDSTARGRIVTLPLTILPAEK
ncbi:hypothetical protein [Propionicimonas sp.]|uniref:hypothetical protein n=1 Tax=Propionicimonas sp. TaxID=1955623 RepID=UPI0039E3EDE7